MRREFILILLGIICISTLSSLLTGNVQNVNINNDKILLDTVVSDVGAGNFSYWQLGHVGPLIVELTSITGDADLYVSDASSLVSRPSYELDKYNFSSTTCGHDVVKIPFDFPRPIVSTAHADNLIFLVLRRGIDTETYGIGVFGHWSHAVSEFSIQVYYDNSFELTKEDIKVIENSEGIINPERTVYPSPSKNRPWEGKKEAEPTTRPRFMRLINIIDMIFDMFLL